MMLCHYCIQGLSFLVFPFLPASNLFFPVGFVVAERILYVPSMGFCVLVSYGMNIIANHRWVGITWFASYEMFLLTCRPKLRAIIGIVLAHVLVFYSFKTIVRNRDW